MCNPKYHHLIPQTYLKAWIFKNKSIHIAHKNTLSQVEHRNIERIAGIKNYHTIKAGMMCCNKSDTDSIFIATKDYIIKFQGKVVSDTLELNQIYGCYDEWEVTRLDGSLASKKKLKNAIDSVSIKEIEILWSKLYENEWNSRLQNINHNILKSTGNTVPEFDKKYLMKFFVALDWRGFSSNDSFRKLYEHITEDLLKLKSIKIPENERIYPFLVNAYEEMYHCSLLIKYRDFLNEKGVMYEMALKAIDLTSFHFYVARGTSTFITSDNPSFSFVRAEDGLSQAVLPVNPRILMIMGKNSDKETNYYISNVTDQIVKNYNKLILDNAVDFIILDNPSIAHF